MKKLLFAVMAILIAGMYSVVKADSYAVILTSYTVGSNTTTFAATYPQVGGGVLIDKVMFVTTTAVTTPLLIGVYDNATSTTAANVSGVIQYYLISSSQTTGMGGNTCMVDYPAHNPLRLKNPAFFKADADTTHGVYMSLIYR